MDIATRVIGVIVALNGFHLATEVPAIASVNGIHPWLPAAKLRRETFGPIKTLIFFPSEILRLLLLVATRLLTNSNDLQHRNEDTLLLQLLSVMLGCSGLLMAIVGYPCPLTAITAWFLYVVICDPVQWFFPWHCLLAESLLILAVSQLPLLFNSNSDTMAASLRLGELSLRYLLARLMLGFAKTKFAAANWSDNMYLLSFLRAMPVPSPVGIAAAKFLERHLVPPRLADFVATKLEAGANSNDEKQNNSGNEPEPKPKSVVLAKLLKAVMVLSYCFFFFAEVVAPWLFLLAPQDWTSVRFVGAASVFLLMTGVQISGNFGFFPLLTAFLAFPAFGSEQQQLSWYTVASDLFSGGDDSSSGTSAASKFAQLLLLLHTLYGVLLFPIVSWITFAFSFTFIRLPGFFARSLALMSSILTNWRIGHGYGIFPPHTFAAMRICPVFEHSCDGGKSWTQLKYKWQTSPLRPCGSVVPFVHPHLDWAIFYPVGFSGGGSLIHGAAFVATCPFRSYDLRLPVRVAHCLLEKDSRVYDLFDQSTVPNSDNRDSPLFMVRCRTTTMVAPWICSTRISTYLDQLNNSSSSRSNINSNNAAFALTDRWRFIEGATIVPPITRARLQQHYPKNAVLSPVRGLEWMHPDYFDTWGRWAATTKNATISTAAGAMTFKQFAATQLEPLIAQEPDTVRRALSAALRSFSINAQMLLVNQRQREQEQQDDTEWCGPAVTEVARDLYAAGVRAHGPDLFDAVASLIMKLTRRVEHYLQTHDSASTQTHSCFIRHMAALACVGRYFSAGAFEQDPDPAATHHIGAEFGGGGGVGNEDGVSVVIVDLTKVTCQDYLRLLLNDLTRDGAGPCSTTAARHRTGPLRNRETATTILAVLLFVGLHSPSLRQEASIIRCIDAVGFVGVDPEEFRPTPTSAAVLPGYIWFFGRWIFKNSEWDATDEVAGKDAEEHEHTYAPSDILIEGSSRRVFASNTERAPHASSFVTQAVSRQQFVHWLHLKNG